MQLDLANGELALKQLFLVVIDDGLGSVEEVALVVVVAAADAQLEERDAAEEAELGRIDADVAVEEGGFELTDNMLSDDLGIGPVKVEPAGSGDAAEDGENQASDQAFPPEHGSPSISVGRAFRGSARERGG